MPGPRLLQTSTIAVLALLAALTAAVAATRTWLSAPSVGDPRVFMSTFVPPTPMAGPPAVRLALSPDGTRLAYVAPDASGRIALWVRPLDELSARPLAGTLNASGPFVEAVRRWL
jgi:hypothetical protein